MASILTGAAQVAHSAVAGVLAHAQIEPGQHLPPEAVKEDNPEHAFTIDYTGKKIFVSCFLAATMYVSSS